MERIKKLASAVTRVALLSGALLSVAVPASAAVVASWSWSQGVTFTGATFSNGFTAAQPPGGVNVNTPVGTGQQTVSASLIEWGCIGASGQPCQSRVVIQPPNPATDVTSGTLAFTNLGPVAGVVLRHDNNPIDGAFATLTSGTFATSITLIPTTGIAPFPAPFLGGLLVGFKETANSNPGPDTIHGTADDCGFPEGAFLSPACPDIFSVPGLPSLVTLFSYDSDGAGPDAPVNYALTAFAAGLVPLTAAACTAAGLAPGCLGFITLEGGPNFLPTGFAITALVPEPASLILLGAGLLGLGGVVGWRRRK